MKLNLSKIVLVTLLAAKCCVAQPFEHVIHISVDGLQGSELGTLMNFRADEFSNFRRFIREGVTTLNARTDAVYTYTLPNHTSMITGRPVTQVGEDPTLHHGYIENGTPLKTDTLHNAGNPAVDYVASVFDVVHDHGLSTAMFASKTKFELFQQSYMATEQTVGGREDRYLEDGDHGTDKLDRYIFSAKGRGSESLVDEFLIDMETDPYNYAFLHLLEPDAVGHTFGWRTPEWADAAAAVDVHLGRVFELVDTHEQLRDRTAIILTADHGGSAFSHSPINRSLETQTIPFFVWGPDIEFGDFYARSRLTRTDPMNSIPDYLDPNQPIRNGDSANLALTMLELPPIEGSSINSRQDLLFQTPVVATWDGISEESGHVGDGQTWTDSNNWSRKDRADRSIQIADAVFFAAHPEVNTINLEGNRTVDSMHFASNYHLIEGDIHLVSGHIVVDEGATVGIHTRVLSDRTVIKEGPGNLRINGTINEYFVYAGTASGDFLVEGDLHNSSVLSPGETIGEVRASGNFDHRANATLVMEITRDVDGELSNDKVSSGGRAFVRGKLSIQPTGDYEDPTAVGDSDWFQLIVSDDRVASSFSSVEYDGVPLEFEYTEIASQPRHHVGDGLFRILKYTRNDVTLINYKALAGDANGDGQFNSNDLIAAFVPAKFENDDVEVGWNEGDWNRDRKFDTGDLVLAFRSGLYERASALTSPTMSVPEPCSGVSAIGVLLGLCVFRRIRFQARRESR